MKAYKIFFSLFLCFVAISFLAWVLGFLHPTKITIALQLAVGVVCVIGIFSRVAEKDIGIELVILYSVLTVASYMFRMEYIIGAIVAITVYTIIEVIRDGLRKE